MSPQGQALQVGERFKHAGSEWTVTRTTPCAAYCRENLTRPKLVTIVNRDGSERSFTATQGTGTIAISLHSSVERIGNAG